MDLTKAFELIRKFEGLRLHAYQDSVGVWTIGYGTTDGVHSGMIITAALAESLMEADVKQRAAMIESWLEVNVTGNEMSAMISLAYNIGMKAFHHSEVLTFLNDGQTKEACAKQFMNWVHAGGKILPGLVTRRAAEKAVFLT